MILSAAFAKAQSTAKVSAFMRTGFTRASGSGAIDQAGVLCGTKTADYTSVNGRMTHMMELASS